MRRMHRGAGMQVLLVSLAILSVALTAAGDGATAAQPAPPRDLSSAGLCRRVSRAGCKWPLSRLCRRTCGTAANAAPLAGSPAQSALPASRVLMPASLRPSNSSHISRKLRGATKAPTKAPSKAPAKQILARAGTAIVSNPSPLYTYTAQMHNTYRVRHQKTPAVVYDAALEVTAQAWANKCIWAHSGTPNVGENLYEMFYWTDGPPPAIAQNFAAGVANWYNEIKLYSYAAPGFSEATGHFTQVVWAGSTRVGCAVSTCDQGAGINSHIFVCQYAPAGNINTPAYFKANVLPLKAASG